MLTHNYVHTLSPEADITFVRASITDKCNLNCLYCAKEEGMENVCPKKMRGKQLSFQGYLANLRHIRRNGIRGVSFTGGEPALRHGRYLIEWS
jgi:cyclic pyranopterin phosphate synthase